ncbi:MAG: hypothetical protein IPL61_03445 [Myxococcales bacterium]|nr:hypothetical protein [Myxococcales bacterium]
MRLGSCIAVEAVTLVAILGGVAWGASSVMTELRGPEVAPRRDVAVVVRAALQRMATTPRPPEPAPAPPAPAPAPPAPLVAVDPLAPVWSFAGRPDDELLAPLRVGAPTRIKVNRGGTSLSLRLDFDNGARAAFKPDQIFGQSNPRREIAAYRIDRLLGIGRVPPAIAVSYPVDVLIAAVDRGDGVARARLRDETIPRQGRLRGELSWWIPVLADGKLDGGVRIDATDGIVTWRRWLKAGASIPPARLELCKQLSTMALFDFVIGNTDRWTGSNARMSEDNTILYFMDNTLAFGKNRQGHHKSHLYLQRVQTFSRALVARLRALDEPRLRAVLSPDTGEFEQLLTDAEIDAVLGRRDRALAYVDELIAIHGDAKVLAFP